MCDLFSPDPPGPAIAARPGDPESWDPLFRNANLSHQMLLALARVVTTKVVLRPDGGVASKPGEAPQWDLLSHQSGMVGSAILFGNASCRTAMTHFPPRSVKDDFAVSFIAKAPPETGEAADDGGQDAQSEARAVVRGIAKLKVHRAEFDKQADALLITNVVYQNAEYDASLVARWCPDPAEAAVPPVLLESVVAVPVGGGDPGQVVAEGPGDATAGGGR